MTFLNSKEDEFISSIQNTQLLVEQFIYECKPSTKIIGRRIMGSRSLSLSQEYLNHLVTQSSNFEEDVIKPFSKYCKHKFLTIVEVDVDGELDTNNLKVEIRISCPSKITSAAKTYQDVLDTLLPFAEYLEHITVGVHKNRVCVVEGEFTISAEDLLMVIEEPITYANLADNWMQYLLLIYHHSKTIYSFESKIDIVEGKIYPNQIGINLKQIFPK